MKKPTLFMSFVLLILASCSDQNKILDRESTLEEFENNTDAVKIIGFTPYLFNIIKGYEENGLTIQEIFQKEEVQKLNSTLLKSYQNLLINYDEETITQLSQIAYREKDREWIKLKLENAKSKDSYLTGFSTQALIQPASCGGTCGDLTETSMANSCISGCAFSYYRCLDVGTAEYLCASSYSLCTGNCCSTICG